MFRCLRLVFRRKDALLSRKGLRDVAVHVNEFMTRVVNSNGAWPYHKGKTETLTALVIVRTGQDRANDRGVSSELQSGTTEGDVARKSRDPSRKVALSRALAEPARSVNTLFVAKAKVAKQESLLRSYAVEV